ncbi:RDD family protein [Microcoleus sp. herbarium12]|jgi:uncharacterized RDD family membrane protein YckC|uniref:RDD family protein n=1 Tax=Microcoleus sp. herbarium12 TaxID=3055437 RepID=UPI002FD58302
MTRTTGYAGIDKRFVASLIDGIILNIVGFIIVGRSPAELTTPDIKLGMYLILITLVSWVYYAVLESSSMQGTLGKRVVGIIVTNLQGNKISFGKATARYFAKSICVLFWILAVLVAVMAPSQAGNESPYVYVFIALVVIGFVVLIVGSLMAVYTPEKQALHDIIARCYVVNGRGQSSSISWKPIVVMAIAVLVSKGIFLLVPETQNSANTSANTSTESVQEPVTPTPSPTPTPTPEPPKVSSIFGELTPASSAAYPSTNGVWELEFAAGVNQHQAVLSMSGDSGFMIVNAPNNPQGGSYKIWQTMTLRQSSKGLVIVGENPTDVDTNKANNTYVTDNILIRVEADKPPTFRNISVNPDNSIVESPVNTNFKGYPKIGIRMEPSSSQNTDVIIKEVNKDSPAAKADLRPGDIIRSVNGTNVGNVYDVKSQIISSLLFSTIKFEINRGGKNISIEVSPECCVTQEQLNQEQSPSPASPASP